jgi:hypothetical protein
MREGSRPFIQRKHALRVHKVFGKPKEVKGPLGQGSKRYVFPEDGIT